MKVKGEVASRTTYYNRRIPEVSRTAAIILYRVYYRADISIGSCVMSWCRNRIQIVLQIIAITA